jgi:hypothetical protein
LIINQEKFWKQVLVGKNINANGTSPRALQKINTKYPNTPNVDSRVVIKNVLGRAKILKWEKNKVDALRRNGLNLWKQFRPILPKNLK